MLLKIEAKIGKMNEKMDNFKKEMESIKNTKERNGYFRIKIYSS